MFVLNYLSKNRNFSTYELALNSKHLSAFRRMLKTQSSKRSKGKSFIVTGNHVDVLLDTWLHLQ